jgi:hypothetical protein
MVDAHWMSAWITSLHRTTGAALVPTPGIETQTKNKECVIFKGNFHREKKTRLSPVISL